MNLQSLMKQAQSMQKNMLDSKKEIESKTFTGKSELVEVKINGKREVISAKIKEDHQLDKDDLEILSDMFVIATNDALKQIESEINSKMGKEAGALSSFL